jgi:hypothetical protein
MPSEVVPEVWEVVAGEHYRQEAEMERFETEYRKFDLEKPGRLGKLFPGLEMFEVVG